ncbi:hypothetical protein GOQ29_12055 [Clostridium sp. D2Q-14]|uniref:hypothetical protein n=1 Tax=Anaeromonas gelatinilytica TaxID=2683194 RepID=UPI00193AFCAE|nr:hypothetical protein [Anaeromonas gelatinilytica]MBS4536350.1 hypothetical protein [Anaeromonas gelatinilytica]
MIDINNIKVRRALKEHDKYCKDRRVIQSNNFFIAADEKNNNIIATGELDIINQEEANLGIDIAIEEINEHEITIKFINEILYWNPFLKTIRYEKGEFNNHNASDLEVVSIEDIQPSQLYISKDKIRKVSSWLDSYEKVIIPVVEIDGRYVSTDGHTRLVQAFINGYKNVYIYMDKDIDSETSRVFVDWCRDENITSIKDLSSRLINRKEYEVKWIGRCENCFKSLEDKQ